MRSIRNLLTSPIRHIPHPALRHLYSAYWSLFHDLPNRTVRHSTGLLPITDSSLAAIKTSDTVFILGSGSSINQISEQRWKAIRKNDSFGFNFWILHEHVPSLYAMEFPFYSMTERWYVVELLARMAKQRARDYQNVYLVLSDLMPDRVQFLDWFPSEFKSRLHSVRTVRAFARNRAEFEASILALRDKGVFAPCGLDRLFKYRATVAMLVSLAVKLRYRNVVLCGIDLNNPAYFYQDPQKYPDTATFQSSIPFAEPVHRTLVEQPMMRPIDEVLFVLKEIVLDPLGIGLYVENRSSALFPQIPLAPDHLFHTESEPDKT